MGYKYENAVDEHGVATQEFMIWNNLKQRVGKGSYTDVSISEDFMDFELWLKWAKQQTGFMSRDNSDNLFHMDKDILSRGRGLEYSKDMCVFVPHCLNTLCKRHKGVLPRGVYFDHRKKKKPYRVKGTFNSTPFSGGYHSSIESASAKYREIREQHINTLKDIYEKDVDPRVWDAIVDDIWYT